MTSRECGCGCTFDWEATALFARWVFDDEILILKKCPGCGSTLAALSGEIPPPLRAEIEAERTKSGWR